MRRYFPLLWADLRHHADAALAVAVAVAIAAATVSFAVAMGQGATGALRTGLSRLGADLAVVPRGGGEGLRSALVSGAPEATYLPDPSDVVRSTPGVTAATAQLFVQSADAACCDEGDVLLVGIDPATDFVVSPWVLAGKPIADGDLAAGAAVNRSVGMPIRLFGERFETSAQLARTGWGYFDRGAFISLDSARKTAQASLVRDEVVDVRIPAGQVSVVFVKADSPATVAAALRERLPDADVVELGAVGTGLRRAAEAATRVAVGVSVLAVLAAAALVAAMVAAATGRRRRDLALMRAMGVSKRGVVGAAVWQVGVIAAPSAVAGAVMGLGACALFAGWFTYRAGIPFTPMPLGASVVLCVALGAASTLVAAAAAAIPAARAASRDPYEGVRS